MFSPLRNITATPTSTPLRPSSRPASPVRSSAGSSPRRSDHMSEQQQQYCSVLTEDMVLVRTNKQALDQVTHLNYWRNQLVDVSILSKMQNLRILSLSFNLIKTLKPLQPCHQLQELYVRHNEIGSELIRNNTSPKQALVQELKYLSLCKNLHTLWICENPCSASIYDPREYRSIVVHCVPSITRLDDIEISNSDRVQALQIKTNSPNRRPHSISPAHGTPSSRPPTPFATSHDDTVAIRQHRSVSRGRSRSPKRPDLMVDVMRSGLSSNGGETYSPQDVRRLVPPHIRTPSRSPSRLSVPSKHPLVPVSILHARDEWPSHPSKSTGSQNVLQAILTLVKDLDEHGLNVLEMHVRESRRGLNGGGM